jgi:hypothetical protein
VAAAASEEQFEEQDWTWSSSDLPSLNVWTYFRNM